MAWFRQRLRQRTSVTSLRDVRCSTIVHSFRIMGRDDAYSAKPTVVHEFARWMLHILRARRCYVEDENRTLVSSILARLVSRYRLEDSRARSALGQLGLRRSYNDW